MAYWLFKQEPSVYRYSQLQNEGRTVWDGVANNVAQKNLRSVRKGDQAFFYHTGSEKQIVGIMSMLTDAYSDPKSQDMFVVDVKPLRVLSKPVPLADIKADPFFSDWELVRISRLSIMPVPALIWNRILAMSEE